MPITVDVVPCNECIHQMKVWHQDRRMKAKGYYLYHCRRNEDPFVSHTVNGGDGEFCCYGEPKETDS